MNPEDKINCIQSLINFLSDRNRTIGDKCRRVCTDLQVKNCQATVKEFVEIVMSFSENEFNARNYSYDCLRSSILSLPKKELRSNLVNKCGWCKEFFPKEKGFSFQCSCFICYDEYCFDSWFEGEFNLSRMNNLLCLERHFIYLTVDEKAQQLSKLLKVIKERPNLNKYFVAFDLKLSIMVATTDPDDVFIYCAKKCGNGGFIASRSEKRVFCPDCHHAMCPLCYWEWTPEHFGKTCEEYLVAHNEHAASVVKKHGTICPQCKMPCEVLLGGCLHTTCTNVNCNAEYCTGCQATMYRKEYPCDIPSHKDMGLHGHHQRNCEYYLRNWEVEKLKEILTSKGVNCEAVLGFVSVEQSTSCSVMETTMNEITKEISQGPCQKPVLEYGLCKEDLIHELIGLINQYNIDPVYFMERNDLINYIKQNIFKDILIPNQQPQETNDQYCLLLKRIIISEHPLVNLTFGLNLL